MLRQILMPTPKKLSPPLLMSLATAVLALVLFGRLPAAGRWASDLENFAHGPAFGLITVAVIGLLRHPTYQRPGIIGQYWLAIAVAVLLGGLVELLQSVIGGHAALSDFVTDTLGALAATGFLVFFDPDTRTLRSPTTVRLTGLLVGLVGTVIVSAPLAMTAAAYIQRCVSFPTLVDFSTPWSTRFLGAYSAVVVRRQPLPDDLPGHESGDVGLHASVAIERRWGLAVWEPIPDWRGYQRLALDIANPTGFPLQLQVRIRDKGPSIDGYGGYLGRLVIPARSRERPTIELLVVSTGGGRGSVDITQIDSIALSADHGNLANEFYLVGISLE